ncbi:MAG: galactokinase family protein [Arachnia sp.]
MTGWFVPGRLEVLGKHTDYAGGNSLLAAVDHGVRVSLTEAGDCISATTTHAEGQVQVRAGQSPDLPPGHWGRYLHTVVDRLTSNFGPLHPARLDIDSDLPPANGMSSSSAVVVAVALTLIDHNQLREHDAWTTNITTDTDLAEYLACIENGMSFRGLVGRRGVGTFGGSEDHTAMLCCRAGEVTRFRFMPITRHESVAVPEELTFVVATSGVPAQKTGAAKERYNRAAEQAREVVRLWNLSSHRRDASIGAALSDAPDAVAGLRAAVAHSRSLTARLNAFLNESEELIAQAVAALAAGDLAAFGSITDDSQRDAGCLLGNQIPETVRMQALARQVGAHAASAFGAGFGGSVWALVDSATAEDFAAQWLAAYQREFDHRGAGALIVRPGGPARPTLQS